MADGPYVVEPGGGYIVRRNASGVAVHTIMEHPAATLEEQCARLNFAYQLGADHARAAAEATIRQLTAELQRAREALEALGGKP